MTRQGLWTWQVAALAMASACVGCQAETDDVPSAPATVQQAIAACAGCALDWQEFLGDAVDVHAVDSDPHGNLYIVGKIEGGWWTPPPRSYTISPAGFIGGWDGFILSVDASGNFRWGRRVGSTEDDALSDVSYDPRTDRAYVTGYMSDAITLDSGVTTSSYGDKDVFVAAYDASTGFLGVGELYGGSGDDVGYAIAADRFTETFGVVGSFSESIDFGLGAMVSPTATTDAFVARLDAGFGPIFSDHGGDAGVDIAHGVALAGEVLFVVGEYADHATFASGVTLSPVGGQDIFMIGYGYGGSPFAVFGNGSPGDDVALDVDVDTNFDVVVAGAFEDGADLGGGGLGASSGQDGYWAKYDFNLNHLCEFTFSSGASSTTIRNDRGVDLAADDSGNTVLLMEYEFGLVSSSLDALVVEPSCDVRLEDSFPGTGEDSSIWDLEFGPAAHRR